MDLYSASPREGMMIKQFFHWIVYHRQTDLSF